MLGNEASESKLEGPLDLSSEKDSKNKEEEAAIENAGCMENQSRVCGRFWGKFV
jgi:hypothetical protein